MGMIHQSRYHNLPYLKKKRSKTEEWLEVNKGLMNYGEECVRIMLTGTAREPTMYTRGPPLIVHSSTHTHYASTLFLGYSSKLVTQGLSIILCPHSTCTLQ